jgi:hypothetical protein
VSGDWSERCRRAESACRAVGFAKAEGALHSGFAVSVHVDACNRFQECGVDRRDAQGPARVQHGGVKLRLESATRTGATAAHVFGLGSRQTILKLSLSTSLMWLPSEIGGGPPRGVAFTWVMVRSYQAPIATPSSWILAPGSLT